MFWDHYGYVLKQPKTDLKKTEEENYAAACKQHSQFLSCIQKYAEKFPENREIQAVKFFYNSFDENLEKIQNHTLWPECCKIQGCNMSFRLSGFRNIVAEHKDITSSNNWEHKEDAQEAICLITGKKGPIATLHTGSSIPGGKADAVIVSFQKDSGYDSYYKIQGMNAPVSLEAEAAYTTALNTLLAKDSENKYQICDTTYVFWATKANILEKSFLSLFSAPSKDDPDRNIREVKSLLDAIKTGVLNTNNKDKFYILGLAPNGKRISIRFWKVGTTKEIGENIEKHFRDAEIIRGTKDPEYIPFFTLLAHIALEFKISNVQPNLAAAVMSSVIEGTLYPETLLQQCLRRIKAEQHVNRVRASILKACLNRKIRIRNYNHEEEITVALDKNNANVGYLCGRLFAVLEKIQAEAFPGGINAGIKERYYGAASSTPVTVFGRLISLSNHHLSKLKEEGRKINLERLVSEIMAGIPGSGFPKHLSLDDQARFAIGYYHQRQNLYTKKDNRQEETNE